MNKETLDILKNLSKRKTTNLALSIMELTADNLCKDKEIERLNNIINRMEEDLKEMYMTFGEFNEEYTEKKIRELKEGK